jgi:hypothetical protein
MNLIQRVQDILLKPKETWPVIEQETGDVKSIYKEYLIYVAAIPAVAQLLGVGLFSLRFMAAGLVMAVIGYVLALAIVYGLALIANELAPTFGGTKNLLNAFKLMAYASTASYVGGIFHLIPALGTLALLAALYGIYLIYTGIPVLMKSPVDKAPAYTAVLIVCGIVAMLVVGGILASFMPLGSMGMR